VSEDVARTADKSPSATSSDATVDNSPFTPEADLIGSWVAVSYEGKVYPGIVQVHIFFRLK